MFSYLIIALFFLSLSVSSLPMSGSLSPCDLPTATVNATATSVVPPWATDDCSDPTTAFTPAQTTPVATVSSVVLVAPSTPPLASDDCSGPTSTPTAAPTTSVASTPATSSAPFSTSTPLETVSAAPTTSVVSTPATSSAPVSVTPTTSVVSTPATSPVSDASSSVYTGGIATYFYQNGNPGACGQVNPDTAFICAMDQTRFGTSGPSSPLCGKHVQITNTDTGDSITVTVADDCPTCENENSIDLSVAAFEALAPLSQGIFPISWKYV